MHARRLATRFAALTLAALTFAPSPASRADDTELFTPTVVPNVLLVIDNSGSMNNIMWHPAFDPAVASTCNYWENDEEYHVNTSSSDTTPDPSDPSDDFKDGSYSIPSPVPAGCVASAREIFLDPAVQADGNNTRWTGEYLNWYYSAAANAYVSEITAPQQRQLLELPRRRHVPQVPPRPRHRREERAEGRDLPGEPAGRGALRPGAVPHRLRATR